MGVKFFANKLNGGFLRNILPSSEIEVDWVKAAIAYGSDWSTLIENCIGNRRRLDIWMRYDHTVPVAPPLLRKLLKSTYQNVFCYLIPDVLHAKIIWWKGYGVYIGSANLTDRAWNSNIEFGVFLSESDLERNGDISEIESFFSSLERCDAAFELNEEIVQEQERLSALRAKREDALNKETEALRKIKRWAGPTNVVTREKANEQQKNSFIQEWRNGLSILKTIADIAPRYRPTWLNENVPAPWQADQFLHAYYYNEIVDGRKHPFEDYYIKHKNDPASATKSALIWWSKLTSPPSNEDENCHVRAPLIRERLSPSGLRVLTVDQFAEVCLANHSTMDHVRRMTNDELGVPEGEQLGGKERAEAFARLLWSKTNSQGECLVDLLRFVLDGGPKDELASRVYDAAKSPGKKFTHLGPNQLAELAGWARPDMCPPRNGRTSKGLKALGYNVKV
jgi:hypothetical protein